MKKGRTLTKKRHIGKQKKDHIRAGGRFLQFRENCPIFTDVLRKKSALSGLAQCGRQQIWPREARAPILAENREGKKEGGGLIAIGRRAARVFGQRGGRLRPVRAEWRTPRSARRLVAFRSALSR